MKAKYRTIIIASISTLCVLLATTEVSESCGSGYESEDYRVSFFSNSLLSDRAFFPFYYTSKMLNADASDFGTDKYKNLKLWQTELGGDIVLLNDIDAALYGVNGDSVVNANLDGKLKDLLPNNSFLNALLLPKNKALLDYFLIAKENEAVNFVNSDPWGLPDLATGFDETKRRSALEKRLEAAQAAAKTPFLKQRYAYLQLVNYRYLNSRGRGIKVFEQHFDLKNKDLITTWAIFHAAFLEMNAGKSNYYLSLAFDRCDSKKERAYSAFVEKMDTETLAFAKNEHERATIFALKALNEPDKRLADLKKVAALDATHEQLEVLVGREINKIEDWLLTPTVTGMPKAIYEEKYEFFGVYEYNDDYTVRRMVQPPYLHRNEVGWKTNYFNLKNYETDLAYAREVRSFLIELLDKTTSAKRQDFLRLAISHLFFLDNQPTEAVKYNNLVKGKTPQIKAQQQVNTVLLTPLTENITEAATKQRLFEALSGFQRQFAHFENPLRTVSQLHLYLAKMYFRKGDVATAALLHRKTSFTGKNEYGGYGYYSDFAFLDRYASTAQVGQVLTLLEKTKPTSFEGYLLEKNTDEEKAFIKKSDGYGIGYWAIDEPQDKVAFRAALLDLQGTIAFREGKWQEALAFFKKLPDDYWQKTYEFATYLNKNPFLANTDSRAGDENPKFTSKVAVVEMLLEKQKAAQGNDAKAWYELGNAQYNFTYWGKAWMMFSYGNFIDEISPDDAYSGSYTFYPNGEKYFDDYYGCSRAAAAYRQAMTLTKDKELKAKAAFMLANCQKLMDVALAKKAGKEAEADNKYLAEWVKTYKKTATYKDFAISCGYITN